MLHALPEAASSFPLFDPEEDRKGRQNLPGLQRIRQNYTKGISKMQWTNQTAYSHPQAESKRKSQWIFTLCETKVINTLTSLISVWPVWRPMNQPTASYDSPTAREWSEKLLIQIGKQAAKSFRIVPARRGWIKVWQGSRQTEENRKETQKDEAGAATFQPISGTGIKRWFWWGIHSGLEEFNFHFKNRSIIFRPLPWSLKKRKRGRHGFQDWIFWNQNEEGGPLIWLFCTDWIRTSGFDVPDNTDLISGCPLNIYGKQTDSFAGSSKNGKPGRSISIDRNF